VPGNGFGWQNPLSPESVAWHCCIELKLQLMPLWPVPKFAHQLPSARAAVAEKDKAANVIKTNGVVRMVPPRP